MELSEFIQKRDKLKKQAGRGALAMVARRHNVTQASVTNAWNIPEDGNVTPAAKRYLKTLVRVIHEQRATDAKILQMAAAV